MSITQKTSLLILCGVVLNFVPGKPMQGFKGQSYQTGKSESKSKKKKTHVIKTVVEQLHDDLRAIYTDGGVSAEDAEKIITRIITSAKTLGTKKNIRNSDIAKLIVASVRALKPYNNLESNDLPIDVIHAFIVTLNKRANAEKSELIAVFVMDQIKELLGKNNQDDTLVSDFRKLDLCAFDITLDSPKSRGLRKHVNKRKDR